MHILHHKRGCILLQLGTSGAQLTIVIDLRQGDNYVVEWVAVGLAIGWSLVRVLLLQLRFGTLASQFTPLCLCLSEETLKAVGPFYLVSMPEEVKNPPVCPRNVYLVVESSTLGEGQL